MRVSNFHTKLSTMIPFLSLIYMTSDPFPIPIKCSISMFKLNTLHLTVALATTDICMASVGYNENFPP